MSSKDSEINTGSSLQNVFGSRVSLAELNGDTSKNTVPLSSLTKTNPHKRARSYSTVTRPSSKSATQTQSHVFSRIPWTSFLLYAAMVSGLGMAYGLLVTHQMNIFFPKAYSLFSTNATRVFAMVIAILASVSLPVLDQYVPQINLKGNKRLSQSQDWTPIVRVLAAFLGMMYGASKLGNFSMFWILANPCLWYVLDASSNGMLLASSSGLVAICVHALLLGKSSYLQIEDQMSTSLWILASYFCAALFFGNLGRRLFVQPNTMHREK